MIQQIRRRKARQSGQGLVEYALAVLTIIGIFAIIDNRIKKGIGTLWLVMAKDIAAGCPGCTPPAEIR